MVRVRESGGMKKLTYSRLKTRSVWVGVRPREEITS